MKKLLAAAFLFSFFASCASAPPVDNTDRDNRVKMDAEKGFDDLDRETK